jgi:hypothetical protein
LVDNKIVICFFGAMLLQTFAIAVCRQNSFKNKTDSNLLSVYLILIFCLFQVHRVVGWNILSVPYFYCAPGFGRCRPEIVGGRESERQKDGGCQVTASGVDVKIGQIGLVTTEADGKIAYCL